MNETKNTMKTDLTQALENGENFGNDAAGWYTVNRPQDNTRVIIFQKGSYKRSERDDDLAFFKNFQSYATRVQQLMNRGF